MKGIIYKENEQGLMCLFDQRSEKFFPQEIIGCCVRDVESPSAKDILELANQIAKKPFKAILELAQSMVYQDNGYLECRFAKAYVHINPDIKEKVLEKLNKPMVDKKTELKNKKSKRATKPVAKTVKATKVVTKEEKPKAEKPKVEKAKVDKPKVTKPKVVKTVKAVEPAPTEKKRGRPKKTAQ